MEIEKKGLFYVMESYIDRFNKDYIVFILMLYIVRVVIIIIVFCNNNCVQRYFSIIIEDLFYN